MLMFDRRAGLDADGNLTDEPPNVYLHSSRKGVTLRVTRLLNRQQRALVDFLLAKPDPAAASDTPCPLPILIDDRNHIRVNSEDSLVRHGIYRDVWERAPLDRDDYWLVKRRRQSEID
ncbi:hypothetical protein OQA88_11500 [Cercophora sp. LCS_1]